MSKVVRVVVLCPNGRRETVNLTPNSSILQILEEACRKQKLNPDEYDVCHYNKPLDLTLPIRFTSLPNNAQLELKPAKNARQESLVTIALQLESGERITKDFVPSVSVWDVVQQCLNTCSEKNCERDEPVCIYMRQKLTIEEMKNSSLRSLGLTKGSAIIRLLYPSQEKLSDTDQVAASTSSAPSQLIYVPKTETSKSNQMKYDPAATKPELVTKLSVDFETEHSTAASSEIHSTANSSEILNEPEVISLVDSENDAEKFESLHVKKYEPIPFAGKGVALGRSQLSDGIVNTSKRSSNEELVDTMMELDGNSTADQSNECNNQIGTIHYIGGRHAVIYSLDDVTEFRKADLPDEFFELTINDVKYLMEQYRKSRLEMENAPLLTKELRNRQLLKRLGRYKQTVIRIYFPERLVLQAVFDASETVQNIQDFIMEYLEDSNLNFYLYTAPPKEKKDPNKSLIESLLIPAAVVYFGCDKNLPSYLSKSLRDKISDPQAAALAAYKSRQEAISNEAEEEEENMLIEPVSSPVEEYKVPGPSIDEAAAKVISSEKVPKWLKLSKK